MAKETFTFSSIPANADQLKAFPEASLDTPFKTAALAMAAFLEYAEDPDAVMAMLDFLKGPESVSAYEKQFFKDRLKGKEYKTGSFFEGASAANNYTPSKPYRITISDNAYSYSSEGYAVMLVHSAGADSDRQIKLRKKSSTGQWFINEMQCFADIRTPAAADPWA